jgi:hypothetical protein
MAGKKRRRKKSGTTMTLRIRAHHPGGDLVSIQISARLKRVPKGIKITKALLADMIRRKAQTSAGEWDGKDSVRGAREGIDPKGITLKIVRWRNPGRNRAGLRGWRTGTQADAWGSLRNPLAAAAISFR